MIKPYQQAFIELAISHKALSFGEFTLKSGRISPYFFNAGKFYQGAALAALGRYYAAAIMDANIEFDVLMGPAYKGIPLAAVTAAALANDHQLDVPIVYNRKETKQHGEGGQLVGAPLKGRVLIIDDVITAGTAIGEVMAMLDAAGAVPAGVVIGLNRQEKGQGNVSAISQVEASYGTQVISIANLNHIIHYLAAKNEAQWVDKINSYKQQYGV